MTTTDCTESTEGVRRWAVDMKQPEGWTPTGKFEDGEMEGLCFGSGLGSERLGS